MVSEKNSESESAKKFKHSSEKESELKELVLQSPEIEMIDPTLNIKLHDIGGSPLLDITLSGNATFGDLKSAIRADEMVSQCCGEDCYIDILNSEKDKEAPPNVASVFHWPDRNFVVRVTPLYEGKISILRPSARSGTCPKGCLTACTRLPYVTH
jgi:hypothetical protein